MFLFPITIPGPLYYTKNKYTSKVIHIFRRIGGFVKYIINWDKVRDVDRIHPDIDSMGEEYFALLRDRLSVFEFFCHSVDTIVNLDYCFSSCRFKYKRYCGKYLKGTVACLACKTMLGCNKIEQCESRKLTLMYMSLYFSELMKKPNIVLKMRRGLGYKRNYNGEGAQIYFNVGTMPVSRFSRFNQIASIKKAKRMLNKRRLIAKRFNRKKRKLRNGEKAHECQDQHLP